MDESGIKNHILKQYRAPLAMLSQAIEICPDDLWVSEAYRNRFWHVAYHAVFYTHFYMHDSEAAFRPWAKHIPDSNYLGPRPWAPNEPPKIHPSYSKQDVSEYLGICREEVDRKVPTLDLEADSGFYWLPFNKLELQFYNIRHLQHHTGQLADRLRTSANLGVSWVRD